MNTPEIMQSPYLVLYSLMVFIPFMIIEYIYFSQLKKRKKYMRSNYNYKFNEVLCNVILYIMRIIMNVCFAFFISSMFRDALNFQIFHITIGLSTLILLFVLQDFLFYCYHIASHKIRLLWISHSVHHSSEYYNFGTAIRTWPCKLLELSAIFWLPLIIIGFSPEWVAFAVFMNLMYQFFLHTQSVKSLGFLELIFNTPSHHRVHHGKNEQYIDKNFGGILIIWDRIFGTFEKEGQPVEFGITKSVNSTNPLKVALFEYINIYNDLVSSKRTLTQKITSLFSMQ